ncbi:MAG: hypothetical protein ABJD97_02470 [Betaproteobacteria bacterium]
MLALDIAGGRTFIETGMIVMRESYSRLFERSERLTDSDKLANISLHHEWIHYLQSITCAAVHNHAQALLHTAARVVTAACDGSIPMSLADEWKHLHETLYGRLADEPFQLHELGEDRVILVPVPDSHQLSMRDLMEGVAVLESYKLCAPTARVEDFLAFRKKHFGSVPKSVYRIAFNWLASAIGVEGAYALLAPVCYLALQARNPPAVFTASVDKLGELSRAGALDVEALADRTALAAATGLPDGSAWLAAYEEAEPAQGHAILDPCIREAISALGLEKLRDLGAQPSAFVAEDLRALSPPVLVLSGAKSFHYLIPGFAVDKLADQVFMWTATVGAAERLTKMAGSDVYQFCRHGGECPHFEAALCHRFFAPPIPSKSHAECGFPGYFKRNYGVDPSVLWARRGHSCISLDALVAELEQAGELGLAAAVVRRRSSFIAIRGEPGYETIKWKAEETVDRAMKAMATQKINDLVEARMFKAAVVDEVRRWAEH